MKKAILAAAACALALPMPAEIVSKDIGDPSVNEWRAGEWVTCGGDVKVCDERPSGAPEGAKTLRLETRYAVRSFGGWNCSPVKAVLPGRPVKLTGWARIVGEKSWGFGIEFADANTNKFSGKFVVPGSPADKPKDVKWTQDWQPFEIRIPAEVQPKDSKTKVPVRFPIKIESLSQNNWGDRNNPEAMTRVFDICDFRLHTDMEGIAPEDRPVDFMVQFPVVGNTFHYGSDKVVMTVSAGSWIGERKRLAMEGEIESAYGTRTKLDIEPLEVLDSASRIVALPCGEPGAYTVRLKATGFPKPVETVHRYVVALKPRALTPEEQRDSTYGINVHGGSYVGYEKFSRLGFTWIRDYAYNFHWMKRARGSGDYGGWPRYPKVVKSAEDAGLMTLPCLMGAVGDEPPDNAWRRDIALIAASFPQLCAFELDNEVDNKMFRDIDVYGKHCAAFGAIMKACRPDALAVSPGLAGIYVEQTQKLVDKGYFKDIDVVNGHRYCGKDAPEYAKANLNTGMSEAKPAYLRDVWRHWKRAACSDGKFRQLWVTEWGWDTLAGQPVSEWEQAAYLQRKWALAMGNGVEKMFWYWYYDDNTDTPDYFFAGCGIFNRRREPKPSAAAFAALRTFIPGRYEYLGTANLGPNHMVQILKADGKVVAMAYKIRKDGPDLEIRDEKAEMVTDMFGRVLKPGSRTLDIAPTWYVGLDGDSDWLMQCPMDLESDFYVRNVGGEPIKVAVTGPQKFDWSVGLPDGWIVEERPYGFDVIGPAGLSRGNTSFTVTGRNGNVSKTMSVEVDIVPQAYAKSKAAAFDGAFTMDVTNQSAEDQDFCVNAELPDGWAIEPAVSATGKLKPEETKTLEFKLVKSTPVDPSAKDTPRLSIVNKNGMKVDYAPVIPREWTMHRIDPDKIKIDGDLEDWDPKFNINRFMIGPYGDKEQTKFYFGWCEAGLYVAMDVRESRCHAPDPRSFWRPCDCLELNFTTPPGAKFTEGAAWGVYDHQFWFCPLAGENRIYAGFWGNCKEQKTENDVKDVRQALVKTEGGYRAEMFVPASRLKGWDEVRPGAELGMSFMLSVQGPAKDRELYWPSSKREQLMKKPWTWARVKCAP